ncbi:MULTISPECIES: hypothetical protein [unclassified Devosia]|uniref:hypothetical protein n=1 Tax=unclassified Devosia TaxID=196773 RepID=UPI001AC8C672|nr:MULTISPECIES: hypothetical protein [unclassified Devosia]MBN9360890.1 hypothetical protein [Devosia sp.]
MSGTSTDKWHRLYEKGQEICRVFGLPPQLINDLQTETTDWAFVLKVDALLEMCSRKLVANTLCLKVGETLFAGPKMETFVDKLPTVGRSSIRDLLEVAGCPLDRIHFLDAVRTIRNAYAHDIAACGETILAMVLRDRKSRQLLLAMSSVDEIGYDYDQHVVMIMDDPSVLRFGIMIELLQFMGMSYRQWGPGETPG